MNRIDATFARLSAAGRTALIPYVTAGDPAPEITVPIMKSLVAEGVARLVIVTGATIRTVSRAPCLCGIMYAAVTGRSNALPAASRYTTSGR